MMLSLVFIFSCAGFYNEIKLDRLSYYATNKSDDNTVSLSYAYGVLDGANNKKYAKREDKSNVNVVALKLTNNTDRTLSFPEDYEFTYYQGELIIPMNREDTYSKVKQKGIGFYLFWLFANITINNSSTDSYGNYQNDQIFIPSGIAIAAANIIVATSANGKFKRQLLKYDLSLKKIKPKETAYGLIGMNTSETREIRIRLKQ